MITNDLSLFYKILVLVEDKGTIGLGELQQFGSPRQTLGALGRLEGLGYIQREKEDGVDELSLTDEGDTLLAGILGNIPEKAGDWDKKWRIIVFDVPETKRTIRQMFRLKLLAYGARMLQSSVWITPDKSVMEKFAALVNEHGFASSVYCFEATTWGNNPIDVAKLWELDKLSKEYKELFDRIDKTHSKLKKDPQASFTAKCLIVSLALLMQHDPNLPQDLMPSNWIGYKAQDWYTKLRAFCQ